MSKTTNNTKIHPIQQIFDGLSNELHIIINAAQEDIKSIKGFDNNDPEVVFKMILVLSLCKAIEICQSVIGLLKYDLTLWRVATAITRSLLELYINARIMKKDPINLTERFCRYDFVRRYEYKKLISGLDEELKEKLESSIEKNEKLQSEYEKFKEDYGATNSWHGMTTTQVLNMIKENKEETWLYVFIYRFQSRYIHNETAALEEYLKPTEKGYNVNRDVELEDIDRTLVTLIVFFAVLYDICSDALDFKKEDWINDFLKKFKMQHKNDM